MNVVEQIYDSITAITQTVLGVEYKPLRRVFNPTLNDLRSSEKAFGVLHGAASSSDGVMRFYTLDHSFQVLLSRRFVDRQDDVAIQETINNLYDHADGLLVEMFLKKLNLTSIVMIVDRPSISEPEILDNQAVLLRVGFNVKYRNQIT